MAQHPRPRSLHIGNSSDYRLLHLRDLDRKVSDGASPDVSQSSPDNDPDSFHHLLKWRKLFCHAAVLAHTGIQYVR